MNIDLSALSAVEVYATLTQVVVPRPVAWVLSENADASFNLAPFSYFTAICADPPTVIVSIGPKPTGGDKDTRHNIETRADCIIHIAQGELAELVTASSATLPRSESEVDLLELATVPMTGSRLPRLDICPIALACTWVETHDVGKQGVLYLRVEQVYVDDGVLGADAKGRTKVLADKVDPLGRLGGGEFLVGGSVISIDRPG